MLIQTGFTLTIMGKGLHEPFTVGVGSGGYRIGGSVDIHGTASSSSYVHVRTREMTHGIKD